MKGYPTMSTDNVATDPLHPPDDLFDPGRDQTDLAALSMTADDVAGLDEPAADAVVETPEAYQARLKSVADKAGRAVETIRERTSLGDLRPIVSAMLASAAQIIDGLAEQADSHVFEHPNPGRREKALWVSYLEEQLDAVDVRDLDERFGNAEALLAAARTIWVRDRTDIFDEDGNLRL